MVILAVEFVPTAACDATTPPNWRCTMLYNGWRRASLLFSLTMIACSGGAAKSDRVASTREALTGDGAGGTLDVDFKDCTEYAGFVPVPLANAAPLVPAPYQIASPSPGVANVVVRVAQCRSVAVAGEETGKGIVSQIGINIVSPNGTGDINNYTVYYDTTGEDLAEALRRIGIGAKRDTHLTYDRDNNADGASAHLTIVDGRHPGPAFTFDNQVLIPTASTTPITFTANWWQASGGHAVTLEMASVFPGILFGPESPSVTMQVPEDSALADLFGATTVTFAGLSVANDVPSAHMHVTSS
jgi:hypothetical protein